MNWEVDGLFTDKRGFLLVDALISIMIVSLMCMMVYASVWSHVHVKERVIAERRESELMFERMYEGLEECTYCKPEADP